MYVPTEVSKGATLLLYYGGKIAKRGRIDNNYCCCLHWEVLTLLLIIRPGDVVEGTVVMKTPSMIKVCKGGRGKKCVECSEKKNMQKKNLQGYPLKL